MDDVAHLYRRLGFGLGGAALDAAAARGYGRCVDDLLAAGGADPVAPPSLTPISEVQKDDRASLRAEGVALTAWWIARMVATDRPWREKRTLLWHGHFATSIQKVRVAKLMHDQNELFRRLGGGRFDDLVQAVAKDPAMLLWLDSNTNRAGHPNENFARELMELFTLGIGNYAEADVKEAARAFTGWTLDRTTGEYRLRPRLHDTAARNGEDVVRDLTNDPRCARFVTAKLWSHLAYPVSVDDPVVDELTPGAPVEVDALVRRMATHPAFTSDDARLGLVKQPIEYVVGALRALHVDAATVQQRAKLLLATLSALGQLPFQPPSVGGWGQNGYWLSTASALGRLRFGVALAALVEPPARDVDGLARALGLQWTSTTANALRDARDPRTMLALALASPEYTAN